MHHVDERCSVSMDILRERGDYNIGFGPSFLFHQVSFLFGGAHHVALPTLDWSRVFDYCVRIIIFLQSIDIVARSTKNIDSTAYHARRTANARWRGLSPKSSRNGRKDRKASSQNLMEQKSKRRSSSFQFIMCLDGNQSQTKKCFDPVAGYDTKWTNLGPRGFASKAFGSIEWRYIGEWIV